MNRLILIAGAAGLLATGAMAQMAIQQTTTQSTSNRDAATGTSHNPAIKDSDPAHTAMPADGANSFTEDQARRRLSDAGYTNVTKLAKDKDGVWRGTGSHGGAQVQVGLDYKGNIVTR